VAEIVIRPLSPTADREIWAGMRQALWPHHSLAELASELDDMATGPFAGFGAFDGERIVGFAEASERSYGDNCDTAPVAWLEGIMVLAPYRRGNVARRLVAAVEAWARAAGHRELGSDAELDNLVSRVAHARWGFAETGRSVLYRKVLA
jgi:aminoglycoside 6'-N-acetyltransferase I